MSDAPVNADIVVVGAGPVGMALALALADSPYKIALVDRQEKSAWQNPARDPRALALSHGSRQLLERLGAWHDAATPIRDIHVSQRGGFGRTLIAAQDYGLPALGYVLRYGDLAAALAARLPADALIDGCTVQRIDSTPDGAVLAIERAGRAQRLAARLVVHAEGTQTNGAGAPDVRVRDYRQHAIVAEVLPDTPHGQRAWERFTPDGPLALLPLGPAYAVVCAAPPERAAAIARQDDAAFVATLRAAMGGRIDFTASGPRTAYPLALRVRAPLARPRQIWIGNAAQTLHPVTGQGFNLGLRDAWQLAEMLLDRAGPDPGDPAVLQTHTRQRRLDRCAGIGFTDGIVRLFSNDLPPLRLARGLGLLALDLAPPLRHFVARRMIWGARAWP